MTIPATMQALVQLHDGYTTEPQDQRLSDMSPFVALREVPVPQPGPGQALIKIARAAANPSDIAFIKGAYGQPRKAGIAAGFEGVGEVVAGDTPLLGKRVSFFGTGTGTWAEYSLTDAQTLIPLHDAVADRDAAGLIVNPLTAMAMFDIVRASGTESFIATAAGSQLGKFLIQLGAEHGIPCIAAVRRAEQAAALTEMGAGAALTITDADFEAEAKRVLGEMKPRIMLDAVGGPASATLFFAMPRKARWIVYGRLESTPPALTEIGQFIFLQKQIEGFWLTSWMREEAPERVGAVISEVQQRFADGRWSTDVSAEIPLSRAMEEMPAAYSQPDSKILIAPGG
ncbi:MAG: zinc-binding dehydrogenase [Pseudomonadota bacterium]